MSQSINLQDVDQHRNVHVEIVERAPGFAIIRFGHAYTLALGSDDLDSLAQTLIATAISLRSDAADRFRG